ncbi:MAG: aminoacyl-tRNA hydrolase [Chitinophagales bacterium]|nr:aminoacyl-tRNA hydrolase [Chitinophagales bacterium]HAE35693.1 aminoacyl-tRNA hydrolase [Bacteroidota bacterium]MCB9021605.1 aminoacyl-tRNA hydrolase [Chitinophagales bacterium]MCB9031142.1 aminoacyl-tRNA hydrolase [Chitinophagales bacterium]HPE97007.1 alternative ribosome rescue aminoacyl-tRNA hydrolase ArfB [Chitinophagales bacterium]
MDTDQILKECTFTFSRSGGKGGQHVNKVSTRAEIWWDLETSAAISEEERKLLRIQLPARYVHGSLVHLSSSQSRSQGSNKEYVQHKLLEILRLALAPVKQRKPTKKPAAANRKRLEEKARRSSAKESRNRRWETD